ncbi:tRNA/rRNA methyltransferase SpoU [candidate division SR1 bacterium RAAC1_SR1_1]|nr:tRNA/rRNA methyltransferase SpoU [candidate division SR1 bacterium RAAC1_SR1_1]
MNVVILENIRSAYNVGNIIRTADALGWKVWLTGYSPSPFDIPKVAKTSLGAQHHVDLKQFGFTKEAIDAAKALGLTVLAAEITPQAIPVNTYTNSGSGIAVVFGNEVDGVLEETLKQVDDVVFIPMNGIKESLNVGQSSAIVMWQLGLL